MRSWVEPVAIALLLLLALPTPALAQDDDETAEQRKDREEADRALAGPPPARGTLQIGTDAAGDASYPLAPGTNYPTLQQRARVDIRALEIIPGDPTFTIDINLSAPFRGTASVMYVVHMTMAGDVTYACWNPQNVTVDRPIIGGTFHNESLPEEMEACDRFEGTNVTRVGPATNEEGVRSGIHPDGTPYVRWTVDKARFGGPGLNGLEDVTAETWVRAANPAPPSTHLSDHVWSRADRAPDVGSWNHSFSGVPLKPPPPLPPATRLVLQPAAPPVGGLNASAGQTFSLPVGVGIDQGQANITFSADAVGAAARFDPPLLALTPSRPSGVTHLIVDVPGDVRGTLLVQTLAVSDTGLEARSDLNVTVVDAPPLRAAPPEADDPEADLDGGAGRVKEVDVRRAPGASTWAMVVAVAVGAVLAARRRP